MYLLLSYFKHLLYMITQNLFAVYSFNKGVFFIRVAVGVYRSF